MKRSNIKFTFHAIVALAAAIGLYYAFTMEKKDMPATPAAKTATVAKPAMARPHRKKRVYPDVIKGEAITLKKLTKESAFDYFLAFDEDVRKHLEFPEKVTYGYVEYYVSRQAAKVKKDVMIAYNIWDKVDNKMVGSLQIRDVNDHDPGQLGMWINKQYRGGGRIQEALRLISRAYFKQNPDKKSYNAHVRPHNIASQRAMEKFGLKRTGTFEGGKDGPAILDKDGTDTRYVYEMAREDVEKIGVR